MIDRHIILVGLPGSGKSTVGPRVAEALGVPFEDLDAIIIRRMGMPVARIFGEFGEAHFRKLEREVTAERLAAPPSVIAPGGGGPRNQAIWTGPGSGRSSSTCRSHPPLRWSGRGRARSVPSSQAVRVWRG